MKHTSQNSDSRAHAICPFWMSPSGSLLFPHTLPWEWPCTHSQCHSHPHLLPWVPTALCPSVS